MRLSFHLLGLGAAVNALERSLEDALRTALRDAGALAAESARQEHPYQDRSGTLSASLEGTEPTGQLADGTLLGGAEATAPYAGYVEEKVGSIFEPAWVRVEAQVERSVETHLERAASAAG